MKTLTARSAILVIGFAAALGGCALPTATYNEFTAPQTTFGKKTPADTFALAKTLIEVKQTGENEEGNPVYQVSVLRAGDPRRVFGITPNRKWYGVNTTLSVTKVANTPLVDSISSEVEDKRVEFIKSAAKFLGTIVGVPNAAPAGTTSSEQAQLASQIGTPAIHDLQQILEDLKTDRTEKNNVFIADGLVLNLGPVPNDAIEVGNLKAVLMSRLFVYSSCRPSTLRINSDTLTVTKVAVADPRYVQAVAFPLKGKIQAHTECGVSVLPEQANVTPDIDVAQTALEELKKLREELTKKPDTDNDDSEDSDDGAADDDN